MEIASVLSQIESALAEGDFLQAEELLRGLLAQRPGEAALLYNLGIVLSRQDRLEEAAKAYAQTCDLSPAFFESWINQGVALRDLGRVAASEACFRRALDLRPGHNDALWHLGFVHLLRGNLGQGFPCWEPVWKSWTARWRGGIPGPVWDGSDLRGGTLLVHTDGGFGDSFMMARFLPRLAAQGIRIEFFAEDEIAPLFMGRWEGVHVHRLGDALPAYDAAANLASLPLRLGLRTPVEVEAPSPYLSADALLVRSWRERLSQLPGKRVGLVWKGRDNGEGAWRQRSAPLDAFLPLAELPGLTLVSVQGGPFAFEAALAPQALRLTPGPNEFLDIAAAMESLDAIVTIDTSLAHLAGALGRSVLLLLPVAACWRWFLDREDTPWYPSMRLYRQVRPGDWSAPVTRIAAALAAG
jgi:tetratricopeptide (TPR) repeat protein